MITHSVVSNSETLWTVARQVPLSMGLSRQEYWSGLPFPLPEDLPNLGMELRSSALAGGFLTTAPLGKPSTDTWVTAARIFLSLQLSTQPVLSQGL